MITYKNMRSKKYDCFYIYLITNNKTGDYYIGATTDIVERVKTYSGDPRVFKNQSKLTESIVRWGWKNHSIEILYEHEGEFDISKMVDKEFEYIIKYYTHNPEKSLNKIIRGFSKR
jgi:hypothetical protein